MGDPDRHAVEEEEETWEVASSVPLPKRGTRPLRLPRVSPGVLVLAWRSRGAAPSVCDSSTRGIGSRHHGFLQRPTGGQRKRVGGAGCNFQAGEASDTSIGF